MNAERPRGQVEQQLDALAARVVAMCKARGWSMHWTHRGAYLHLEASELIEAIRGKHGDPLDEAGDVLLVLMSITEYAGIPFSDVVSQAARKLQGLEASNTVLSGCGHDTAQKNETSGPQSA